MLRSSWQGVIKMKKWVRPLLFVLGGGIAGWLYYKFFGCTNGCQLSSNPYLTMGYMGLVGLLLSFVFEKPCKKCEK